MSEHSPRSDASRVHKLFVSDESPMREIVDRDIVDRTIHAQMTQVIHDFMPQIEAPGRHLIADDPAQLSFVN